VCFSLGAAALEQDEDDEALEEYKKAELAAGEAKAAEDPAAPKLVLQSLLAQAAVHMKMVRYANAAETYERAVEAATEVEDLPAILDCWRLSGFCHERLADKPEAETSETEGAAGGAEGEQEPGTEGETEDAAEPGAEAPEDHLSASWDRNEKALGVADEMEDGQRELSTVAYAAAALWRLADGPRFRDRRPALEQRFEALLGAEWKEKVAEASP
jgi:hypothetical protein